MRKLAIVVGLSAALGACVGSRDRGGGWEPEYVGRTLRVEAAGGQATDLTFQRGGAVVATFNGRETRGHWEQEEARLCFTWGASYRECWPHDRPFRTGRTEEVRSDRGNVVKVTLLR